MLLMGMSYGSLPSFTSGEEFTVPAFFTSMNEI